MADMIEVTQVDRDAASTLEPDGRERDQILRGKRDKSSRVQAFARHRVAALTAQREAGFVVVPVAVLAELVEAISRLGLRPLVAGWNGENRPDGPNEPHPDKLGVTLKTCAGDVYAIDRATEAARAMIEEASNAG